MTKSNLTTIFNDADRLRAYFMERGWSIHMEDNGRSVIDPFATIIEAVQGAAIAAQMRAALDTLIEVERAALSQGAAPQAEGLDVEYLRDKLLDQHSHSQQYIEEAFIEAAGRAAPRAEGLWAQRAIERMLRAADTDTRYWIENIVKEEQGATPRAEGLGSDV